MKELTNIQLKKIFQDCKPNKFSKEPDFVKVLDEVVKLLDIEPSEQLAEDVELAFKKYTSKIKKDQKKGSTDRNEDEVVVISRESYVRSQKGKTPLKEVGERQQRRRPSDFVSSTASRADEEGVTPTKLFAFGQELEESYVIGYYF